MKDTKDYGLLIAALVAIVAIVGLVILFAGGGSTGAIPGCDYYCPYGQEGRGQGAFICSSVPCQGPGPFHTVQEADARKRAIAAGGF